MFLRLIEEAGSVCGNMECAVWQVAQFGPPTGPSSIAPRVDALGVVPRMLSWAIWRFRETGVLPDALAQTNALSAAPLRTAGPSRQRCRGCHGKSRSAAPADRLGQSLSRGATWHRVLARSSGRFRTLPSGLVVRKIFAFKVGVTTRTSEAGMDRVANFLPSTNRGTLLPGRVGAPLLSPWQARHSDRARRRRYGRSKRRRENRCRGALRPQLPSQFAAYFLVLSFFPPSFFPPLQHSRSGFVRTVTVHVYFTPRSVSTFGFSSPTPTGCGTPNNRW